MGRILRSLASSPPWQGLEQLELEPFCEPFSFTGQLSFLSWLCSALSWRTGRLVWEAYCKSSSKVVVVAPTSGAPRRRRLSVLSCPSFLWSFVQQPDHLLYIFVGLSCLLIISHFQDLIHCCRWQAFSSRVRRASIPPFCGSPSGPCVYTLIRHPHQHASAHPLRHPYH